MDNTTAFDVSSLLTQIDSLGKSLSADGKQDAEIRKRLRLAAHDLQRAMEEPGDIVERVCWSFLEVVCIRIAIDLDLFNLLVKSGTPQTLGDLINATRADGILLARLLRSLGAAGAVGEVGDPGEEAYVPTITTRTFALPQFAAGVELCFDVLSPSWNKLPAYLKEHNYQHTTDPMNAAFHQAHSTTDHFSPFIYRDPDMKRAFQLYMTGYHEGRTDWTEFFPVEERIGQGARQDLDAILFVDVGGGMGHQGLALKRRYPQLPGRFINQDLPQIIVNQKLEGVESMAHDFYNPQPLKAARIYYLRNILHTLSSTHSHTVLSHLRAAMDPTYSKVLINQWLVPTQRATPFMAYQDLNMLALFNALQRTEAQTRELLEGAGFRILHIWRPDDVESECVIEAVAA